MKAERKDGVRKKGNDLAERKDGVRKKVRKVLKRLWEKRW